MPIALSTEVVIGAMSWVGGALLVWAGVSSWREGRRLAAVVLVGAAVGFVVLRWAAGRLSFP